MRSTLHQFEQQYTLMSGYSGRKGPGVSQYLVNLNAVPSTQEVAAQQDDNFNFEDDLAIFTNTEFFDFDSGFNVPQQPVQYDVSQDKVVKQGHAPVQEEDVKNLGFDNGMCALSSYMFFLRSNKPSSTIIRRCRYERNPPSLYQQIYANNQRYPILEQSLSVNILIQQTSPSPT